MVKSIHNKQQADISTSQSLWTDSEQQQPQTIASIIQQVARPTRLQRRHAFKGGSCALSTSRKWSQAETWCFYQSLQHYGVDFTMMALNSAFVNVRSQKELCNKYKKQCRRNPHIIDKILDLIDEKGLFGSRSHVRE